MANNFNIDITASDKATRVFNQMKGNVGGLNRNLATVNETAHRGAEIFRSMVPSVSALAGMGSIAGIGAMVKDFGDSSVNLKNTAASIGLSTTRLQELHGAAKLTGMTISSVDGGMKSLGTTMENVKFGRDPTTSKVFAQIGVQLHQTKTGAMDTHRALMDISDYMTHNMQGQPQAQAALANQLGVTELLPLLRQGSAGISKLEAQTKALGYVQSDDQLNAGESIYKSFTKAEMAAKGLMNTVSSELAPGFSLFADEAVKDILKIENIVIGLNGDFMSLFDWMNKITKKAGDKTQTDPASINFVEAWANRYAQWATGNDHETYKGMVGATIGLGGSENGEKGAEPWMDPAYIREKKRLAGAVPAAPATSSVPSLKERAAFNILMGTESAHRQVDKNGNPITSSKGAIGMAQVMPDTARMVARQNGIKWDENKYKTDAAYNAQLGRLYFHQLLGTYSGNYAKAYAAYNAGPGRLNEGMQEARKHGNVNDWLAYMPSETRAYVPKNMAALSKAEGSHQKVHVEVTLNNAPAGTSARVTSGGELASVNTNNTLSGVNSP